MSDHLGNKLQHSLAVALLASLICGSVAQTPAQQSPPDFSANNAGWVSVVGA
jgi:hypothetical protein